MGDVALTTPVLKGILNENPQVSITLVTRRDFIPFFEEIPRLQLVIPDFRVKHKGFQGLIRLFRDIKAYSSYDYLIDLHSVLRTWILRSLFRFSGLKSSGIDKGRKEKDDLIKRKAFVPLKKTIDRYLEAFKPLGLKFAYPENPVLIVSQKYTVEAASFAEKFIDSNRGLLIGIAPFALHKLKTWPLKYSEQLIQNLIDKYNAFIILFGGGKHEIFRLEMLARSYENCINIAGKLSLGAEISLMKKLDLMITMDSANMHIAALSGTPTVAIWGATHPYTGFEAYRQSPDRNLQIAKEELPCRPCTVFGQGTCYRGDFACMNWLTPKIVLEKLESFKLIS